MSPQGGNMFREKARFFDAFGRATAWNMTDVLIFRDVALYPLRRNAKFAFLRPAVRRYTPLASSII
jgi:hypothetical protein